MDLFFLCSTVTRSFADAGDNVTCANLTLVNPDQPNLCAIMSVILVWYNRKNTRSKKTHYWPTKTKLHYACWSLTLVSLRIGVAFRDLFSFCAVKVVSISGGFLVVNTVLYRLAAFPRTAAHCQGNRLILELCKLKVGHFRGNIAAHPWSWSDAPGGAASILWCPLCIHGVHDAKRTRDFARIRKWSSCQQYTQASDKETEHSKYYRGLN